RVSPKAAHDYAEIFDGTPSQHDGKDAAVVAELAALGKATAWPYVVKPLWEQELAYWVDWLEAQRQVLVLWAGRLEGLLAPHWPEATRVLRLTKATLLRALAHYGVTSQKPWVEAQLIGSRLAILERMRIEIPVLAAAERTPLVEALLAITDAQQQRIAQPEQ